jgi:hypothetical protein
MRITALSFGIFILLLAANRVAAAADETPLSSLASLAASLSAADAPGALEYFDSKMRNYDVIETNITALASQSDISCFIDVVTDEASEAAHQIDADWFLELKSRTDDALLDRRRVRVKIEMRKFKGHWKVTAMSPLTILDPMRLK